MGLNKLNAADSTVSVVPQSVFPSSDKSARGVASTCGDLYKENQLS